MSVDASDEKILDHAFQKFCKKNGIDPQTSKIEVTKQHNSYEQPKVEGSFSIDISRFKIGMLKMVYEFAVDTVPEYFEDEQAVLISKILKAADQNLMESDVTLYGSGFDDGILTPIEHLVKFNDENHYLILMNTQAGLIGMVSLFGKKMCMGVQLSKRELLDEPIIVGINDRLGRNFKKRNALELIETAFTPVEYRFGYKFSSQNQYDEFVEEQSNPEFTYRSPDGDTVPLYDSEKRIVYPDIEGKLALMAHPEPLNIRNAIIYEYILDEELYIKVWPSESHYQINAIRVERHKM